MGSKWDEFEKSVAGNKWDEFEKSILQENTPKAVTSSKPSAADFLKTGIKRPGYGMSNAEQVNLSKTLGVKLASTPATLSDAGYISLGQKLDKRNEGLMTFKEMVANAKTDKKKGVGLWQRIVNRIGDTSELALKLLPYSEAIDKVNDKISSKVIKDLSVKSGKTEDEVVKEIITRGLSVGNKLDAKLYALSEERQGMSKATQTAGQVAEALGNMLPAVAVGIITKKPDLALMLMSGSAMGSKGQEVYRETGNIKKAYDAGITEAAKEYATERMFGGVAGLGKGVVPAVVGKSLSQNASKAISGFLSTPTGQIAKYLANAGGEGVEEMVSQYLETYVDRTYDPTAAKATKEEILEAGKIGGLVSLILGVGNINVNAKTNQRINEIKQSPTTEQEQLTAIEDAIYEDVLAQYMAMSNSAIATEGIKRAARKAANNMAIEAATMYVNSSGGISESLPIGELAPAVEDNSIGMSFGKQRGYNAEWHIDNRDWAQVYDSKINAFSYDNPAIQKYYQPIANELLTDIRGGGIKGERTASRGERIDGVADLIWSGTKRAMPSPIVNLLDTGYSYAQIEVGLQHLIAGNKGNIPIVKAIEIELNNALSNGYTLADGMEIPRNKSYLLTKTYINGASPVPDMGIDEAELNRLSTFTNSYDYFGDDLSSPIDKVALDGRAVQLRANPRSVTETASQPIEQPVTTGSTPTQSIPAPVIKMPVPEGKGELVPSEFGTSNLQKAAEAGTVEDAIADKFKDAAHYRVGQQESIDAANDIINTNGIDNTSDHIKSKVIKGEALNSTETTAGLILIQEYSRLGKEMQAVSIGDAMLSAASEAGRVLQIYRVMQQSLPGGLLNTAERIIRNRAENNVKMDALTEQDKIDFKFLEDIINTGKVNYEAEGVSKSIQSWLVKLKKELALVEKSKNRELDLTDAAMGKFLVMLEDKRHTTIREKFRGLQRISMLANPKTHVRNVAGNIILGTGERLASPFASLADKGLSKITGERTTFGLGLNEKAALKGMVKGLEQAAQNYRFRMQVNEKFNETTQSRFKTKDGKEIPWARDKSIQGAPRNAFNAKGFGEVLNKVDRLLGYILELGDAPFMMAQYEKVLDQLIKGNPQQVELNGGKPTAEMMETALDSALRITYKDNNEITAAMQSIRNAAGLVGDISMPFVRTPTNLVKIGLEYVPAIGWGEAIYKTTKLIKSNKAGESTMKLQRDIAELYGRGSVGTILIIAGMAMKAAGKATGEDDEERKKEKQWNLTKGITNNSLLINGKYYDISSMPPLVVPFLAGACVAGKLSWEEFFLAMTKAGNSIMDMPVLQGVQELVGGGYGDRSAAETGAKVAGSAATQVIPLLSLSRQFANYADPYKRDTKSTKQGLAKTAEETLNYLKSSVPGLRETLPIKYDMLGNPIENYPSDSTAGRIGNVFLNPANVSRPKSSPVIDAIDELYEKTGDTDVLPRTPPDGTFKNEGIAYRLDPAEKQEWQKNSGKTLNSLMSDLVKTKAYKSASTEEKADMVAKIQDYASDKAKIDALKEKGVSYSGLSFTDKVDNLKQKGIPASAIIVAASTSKENDIKNGVTVNASGSARRALAIANLGLSSEKAYLLADAFDVSKGVTNAMLIGIENNADMKKIMDAVVAIENTEKIGKYKKYQAQAIKLASLTLDTDPAKDLRLKKLLSDAIITKDFGGSHPTNYTYTKNGVKF